MGGSESLLGDPLSLDDAGAATIVDCAGDLAALYRQRAGRYIARVFADLDAVPAQYDRLESLVRSLIEPMVACRRCGAKTGEEQFQPFTRFYILCQYGMNRSGLVTGLLWRALGADAADVITAIRAVRPGALNNETFVQLIERW